MAIVTTGFGERESVGIGRWGISLLIVLALHAGLALWLLSKHVVAEPPAAPPAAVMIELAPLPVAAPPPEPEVRTQAAEPPPEPEPPPPEPLPPEPQVQLPPEPQVQLPPEPQVQLPPEPVPPKPAVTLPAQPPKPRPRPRPKPAEHVRPPPREVVPAPQLPALAAPMPVAPAPVARAPVPVGPSPAVLASARATWSAQLSAWLERYKRYPRQAEEQGQSGTPLLGFALDRHGRVLSARLARSSGFALLDEEALALVRRAQPLPPPPPEIPGERFDIVVPVSFRPRR